MPSIVPPKKLLVNADDFGLSPAINAGILDSHLNGIVRSTSIVASGEAFEEAVSQAHTHVSLGVGVHLTLVEEAAVSTPSAIPTLAPKGKLPEAYGPLIKGVATGRIKLRDIEHEFRAQIEKCLAAGLKLTHLDTHQHTHALPQIFALVVRLANHFSIPGIRIPRGIPSLKDSSADRFLPKCILCLLAHADAAFIPRHNCITTQRFAGLFESGNLTEEAALRIISNLKGGATELVCHPGRPDNVAKYASWNQRRQTELATLTSPRVREAVTRLGIELIDYRQLCDDSASAAGCPA